MPRLADPIEYSAAEALLQLANQPRIAAAPAPWTNEVMPTVAPGSHLLSGASVTAPTSAPAPTAKHPLFHPEMAYVCTCHNLFVMPVQGLIGGSATKPLHVQLPQDLFLCRCNPKFRGYVCPAMMNPEVNANTMNLDEGEMATDKPQQAQQGSSTFQLPIRSSPSAAQSSVTSTSTPTKQVRFAQQSHRMEHEYRHPRVFDRTCQWYDPGQWADGVGGIGFENHSNPYEEAPELDIGNFEDKGDGDLDAMSDEEFKEYQGKVKAKIDEFWRGKLANVTGEGAAVQEPVAAAAVSAAPLQRMEGLAIPDHEMGA